MSFDALLKSADLNDASEWEDRYEGNVRLSSLGVSLPPNVRVLERVASFPKLAVDVLAEALTPEGYTLDGNEEIPAKLRRWWQANNMDTVVHLAILDALVKRRAFWIVGNGRAGVPRITAHGPEGMGVAYDHMGDVAEVVRRYKIGQDEFAAHYLPGRTVYHRRTQGQWRVEKSQEHGASRPAVVPMVNRVRLADEHGRSEIEELAGVSDAASRTLTNLQVAQELLSMPVRYLFGEGLDALVSGDGKSMMDLYMGRMIVGPEGASAGHIPGASLQEFHNTYKLYAQEVSAQTGIPPSMLGISTDNPSSADAMRVAKERLISKAEVKQHMFGDALEDLAKLALEFEGVAVEGLDTLKLHWRDPALPSASAKAANMLQAHSQGVVSPETARDGLGLSPAQKARENARSESQLRTARQLGNMEAP